MDAELCKLTGLEGKVKCKIRADFSLLFKTGTELTGEQVDALYAIEKVNREEIDKHNQRKWDEDLERFTLSCKSSHFVIVLSKEKIIGFANLRFLIDLIGGSKSSLFLYL